MREGVHHFEFHERSHSGVVPRQKTGDSADDDGFWVKANAAQVGFFRVKYSPYLSERLAAAISKLQLPKVSLIYLFIYYLILLFI